LPHNFVYRKVLAAQQPDAEDGSDASLQFRDPLPASDLERWADQGLNIDVPAIPAGLAAFTQSQDV
jgi:hypothetical protein